MNCILHSLNGIGQADIVYVRDNNNVLAWVQTYTEDDMPGDHERTNGGSFCTAIFNPFVGMYYVDDTFGIISAETARKMYPEASDVISDAIKAGDDAMNEYERSRRAWADFGYVIADENGREIAYCDGNRKQAEELRDAVGGDSVIPADEYGDEE